MMARRQLSGKRYWLIGASEGLGRCLAEELDRLGVKLVLSARSQDRLNSLADALDQSPEVVTIDVTSVESVEDAVATVGEVDGVVYLAGAYDPMSTRKWDAEKAEKIADVNFMGALRVFGRIVPGIARRGHGHLVLVGSLAGYRGLPGAIGYGASKAGLIHLAENIQSDLWNTDVKVQVLNPGFIRTRLTDKNDFDMPFLMEPEEAGRTVCKLMQRSGFKYDFPYVFSLFFRVGQFLPQGLYQRLFARKS